MESILGRRLFLSCGLGAIITRPVLAKIQDDQLEAAAKILAKAIANGQVRSATMYIRMRDSVFSRSFGEAKSVDAAFLLGSISKPIVVTALMTLFDKNLFSLDDCVRNYLPEFEGGARNRVTIRQLLTHTSGLPDQLPENADLRAGHAPLSDFVKGTCRVPIGFEPGARYEYSSMGIMLAAEIAQRLSGMEIKSFVEHSVLKPLGMKHSALGMGSFEMDQIMPSQVEFSAIESGGGAPEAKGWNWNSPYWRQLGSPWGGVHASAGDVARFLDAFTETQGSILQPATAKLMIRNHNPQGMVPRGLGFEVSMEATCKGCSSETFGHTGSTGTIAWADPKRDRVCVVLTTLPARAVTPHPRQLVSDCVSSLP
jgi:beta-lactamase class C